MVSDEWKAIYMKPEMHAAQRLSLLWSGLSSDQPFHRFSTVCLWQAGGQAGRLWPCQDDSVSREATMTWGSLSGADRGAEIRLILKPNYLCCKGVVGARGGDMYTLTTQKRFSSSLLPYSRITLSSSSAFLPCLHAYFMQIWYSEITKNAQSLKWIVNCLNFPP